MLFLPLLLAGEPQWDCDDPIAQQEMNYCAAKEFEKADVELNAQWKVTAAAMKALDSEPTYSHDDRPGYFATLLEGQRDWLKYRDSHCKSEGYLFRGGTMEPLMVSTCKTSLTQERIKQLKYLIEQ